VLCECLCACLRLVSFDANLYPKDSIEDEPGTTLFVTRERGEHVNLYHSHTDFLNMFQTMEQLEVDPTQTSVVVLDNHPLGNFDVIFDAAFSKRSPMRRAASLVQRHAVVRFAHAVFVPPGYSSMLYSELNGNTACPQPLRSVSTFAPFVLESFGIHYANPMASPSLIKVVRPHPSKHSFRMACPPLPACALVQSSCAIEGSSRAHNPII
jgi:hypothetical protein